MLLNALGATCSLYNSNRKRGKKIHKDQAIILISHEVTASVTNNEEVDTVIGSS